MRCKIFNSLTYQAIKDKSEKNKQKKKLVNGT